MNNRIYPLVCLFCLLFIGLAYPDEQVPCPLTVFDRIDQRVESGQIKLNRGWLEKTHLICGKDPVSKPSDERIPSGTGYLLKLQKSWHRLSPMARTKITGLLTPTQLPAEKTRLTADGNFRIHYTLQPGFHDSIDASDQNRNGLPDMIDRVEESLIHCWDVAVDDMGWGIITNDLGVRYPGGILDVFLSGNRSAVDGFAFFKHLYSPFENLNSLYMQIAPEAVEDHESLRATTAHLLVQALHFIHKKHGEAWWREGVAMWMETRIYPEISRYREYLNLRFRYPETALTADHGFFPFSNALWVFFLSEKFGEEIVLDICLESRRQGNKNILAVTDRVLRERWHSDLIRAFREYTVWNFFTKKRDDRHHYRHGSEWESIRLENQYDIFPMTAVTEKKPLGFFGTTYFRFLPDGSDGGIILTLESLKPAYLIGEIITVSNAYPEVFDVIPVGERINEGKLDIGIPWKNLSEIILVATRVDAFSPKDVKLSCSAVYDATIPVEFSSFIINCRQGENTLIWTTGSECCNFGYLVYRAADRSQDFKHISDSIIPAIGDSSTQTNYIYLDSDVTPGGKYDYFIRAFTAEGLHYDSFILSTVAR